jgi:hypothetical protein
MSRIARRVLRWLLPLVVVLVLGGLVARTLVARKAEQARVAAAVTRAAPAIDLAPGDVVTATQTELTRTRVR